MKSVADQRGGSMWDQLCFIYHNGYFLVRAAAIWRVKFGPYTIGVGFTQISVGLTQKYVQESYD